MIKLQKYTPEVYYNQSRDFQFIGRLYDIVLNSVKTNADLIYNIPLNDNTDTRLIDLLAMSLGFKAKHNYSTKQLVALCNVFSTVLKNKGNITAVQLAGQALLNSEGVSDKFECYMLNGVLYLFIPSQITDISLFKDLLEYIIPAGISCKIVRSGSVQNKIAANLTINSHVTWTQVDESVLSTTGFSTLIKPESLISSENIDKDAKKHLIINSTVNSVSESAQSKTADNQTVKAIKEKK